MEKIRVYNDRKYAIGLVMPNGVEHAIRSGSFALLSRDDIEYAASIAPALFMGEKQLRLEDRALAAQLGFIESEQSEMFDTDAITRKLNQRGPQVKAWLERITEPYLLDAICDVAAGMDLPASKLQLLQERMPDREFLRDE